jgi:hypothetical protein
VLTTVVSTRRAQSLLLTVALALSVAHNAGAQEGNRRIRIRDFGVLLTVHSDGSLDVVEKITFRFTGSWNGIVRDLSLDHNTGQGRKVKFKVSAVSVTDLSGHPLRVEQDRKNWGWTRELRISIPNAVNADRAIIIRYRVANAIRFFYSGSKVGELDELYWNVTGNKWDMPIDSVHATVVLPEGVTATRAAAYSNELGSVAADAKIEQEGSEVYFTLVRHLARNEGMTIGVGWPAGNISPRASEQGQKLAGLVRRSPTLIPFIVFLLAFMKWLKRGRDPEEGSVQVRFEPADGASPAELGTLVDNTADLRDITSTLVDLAVRGFIRIEETAQSRILGLGEHAEYIIHIVKKHAEWIGLKPYEIRILGALSSASPFDPFKVLVAQLRNTFPSALPRIRDGVFDSLVSKRYYRERPDEVRKKWIALAVIIASTGYGLATLGERMKWVTIAPDALMTAGVASAVIVLAFGMIMPARTVAGARARGAALGFKEFLGRVESERYKEMITSPEMFERFLPYAMAFGVESKWARRFEGIYRNPPSWYMGSRDDFSASSLSESMSDMSSAAATSMSSSSGASGSDSGSGGGGSSGGGSGGGGGTGF